MRMLCLCRRNFLTKNNLSRHKKRCGDIVNIFFYIAQSPDSAEVESGLFYSLSRVVMNRPAFLNSVNTNAFPEIAAKQITFLKYTP